MKSPCCGGGEASAEIVPMHACNSLSDDVNENSISRPLLLLAIDTAESSATGAGARDENCSPEERRFVLCCSLDTVLVFH